LASNDATNSGLTNLLTLSHTTTGTAGDGIGTRIVFEAEDDGGTASTMGYIDTLFTDVSDGAEKSAFAFSTRNGGSIAEAMRIDSSGNVGVGVTPSDWRSTTDAIQFGQSASISSNNNANAVSFTSNAYVNSSNNSVRISTGKATNYYQYDGEHVWDYAGSGSAGSTISYSEAMRIDSSGNLLVGKTSADNGGTVGHELHSNNTAYHTRSGGAGVIVNRLSSDGNLAVFQKDGTTVGSIVATQGRIAIGNGDTGVKFSDADDSIMPFNVSTNANRDNAVDLGYSSVRFDDIYATNGTIQTSDRNEKQDIAELSDAEQRVAVAAKGLLRKFRWKSAVEAKGDEARTHFGIIAQDLQSAFAAEGLDAGDYSMFISSTWTDEETGEERTRMGVRYSELLAFIIAAI
jgi:hypothetical protein